jgi:hypothetical protein
MKKLLLSLFLISGITYGQGDPAPYIKGQAATGLGNQASTVLVPNQQSTKINAYQARIETGNGNLLSNPSFEAGTYNSGWTCSLGSTTLETTAKTDGNKANAINSIGAGVRCYQTSTTNAANLKGLLGSAIVKIKTTDSIYKVCGLVDGNAAVNERNCITVKPTSADLPFYPARTDFYMGGTSNGIVIYTTTTTVQPTVIDDAFVGVFNGGLSQFSNSTTRVQYTPVFTGFGAAPTNVNCFWARSTIFADIDCSFTSDTTSGVEARISLPLSLVSGSFTGIKSAGTMEYSGFSASAFKLAPLIEPSVSYITVGLQSSTTAALTKALGNAIAINGTNISFKVRIPIAGWEANTNAAIAGCVDAFGCTDTFSAKVSSTGVISGENIPGWLSSCTYSSGSVCVFKSNLFTSVPNCWIGNFTTGASQSLVNGGQVYNVSTAGATFASIDAAGTGFTAKNQTVYCQKSGADFKPKTVVVSPLQGYAKTPNAENSNIIFATFKFGGASNITPCTAASCTIYDNYGGLLLTAPRASIGAYNVTLDTNKFSYLACTFDHGVADATANKTCGANGYNGTSGTMQIRCSQAGSANDAYPTAVCFGIGK